MTSWTPDLEAELRYLSSWYYHAVQVRKVVSCDGKAGFSTQGHAHSSRPKRDIHGSTTVYRCRFCGFWHVGSHLSPKKRDAKPKVWREEQRKRREG